MTRLADVEWLLIGSTENYADVKKFIAHICRDVTHAACIDEICINDICKGFRMKGYEVVSKAELDALTAELAALRSPDYIIIPRTMLLELGDKIDALQAAIDQPVTTDTD